MKKKVTTQNICMPKRRVARHRRRKGKKVARKKYSKIQSLKVRQPGAIVPDRLFMKMMYIDTTSNNLAIVGSTFGYFRYNANGLFDPNPIILTGNIAGFVELSALYARYRVRGCSIRLNTMNQLDQPVNIVIWPSNEDPATLITNTYLQGICAQPYSKYRSLSAKGGSDRTTLKGYMSTKKVVGSTSPGFEQNYAGTSLANPTDLWFWNIASYSITNTAYVAAGVPFECRVTMYVEWYERKVLG